MVCTFLGGKLSHTFMPCTPKMRHNLISIQCRKDESFQQEKFSTLRSDLLNALHVVEPPSEQRIDHLKEFVRTVLYAGKKNER